VKGMDYVEGQSVEAGTGLAVAAVDEGWRLANSCSSAG
jgi:hypothetical protein